MSDTLTSSESAHLTALWRRYDAATDAERPELRQLIQLHIVAGTYRRVIHDLQTFHAERNK